MLRARGLQWHLTPPSSGRPPAGCAGLRSPLMSNVRPPCTNSMFPASASKLKPGDFCFVPRADGRFVPFAFLCPVKGKRGSFYGGILDVSVPRASAEELPAAVRIKEFALVHIGCFKENDTPIVGNIASCIGAQAFAEVNRTVNDLSIGATSKVWGHRTILKYAAAVA